MPENLITLRLKPDQLKKLINSVTESTCTLDGDTSDLIELLVNTLDANPAGERLYSLEQILEVIRGTSVAEVWRLGISLVDVRASFKLLDERLDKANGAG